MKRDKKTIIIAASTLSIGLLFGWLLFGGQKANSHDNHEHVLTEVAGETIWTCSMHPQIRQNEPGDCPICGMDLIPLDQEHDSDIDPMAISMSPTAMQLASVSTAVVGAMDPVKLVRLNGKVQSDERLVSSQSSHIPGRVEKLLLNFTGEYVKQGQVIASVYSPELVTAQEELFEAQKIQESQPQLFSAAKEKLKNWKLSENQIDQILLSGTSKEIFDVQADMSGYVIKKMVNPGDYILKGEAIYEIADLSKVWVLFDVYESEMPWIKENDKVQFSFTSLPGESFTGTISFLDPVINPKTRVAKARVEVINRELRLKPEMFASGMVEAKLLKKTNAIVIPKTAVMWTGKRSVVYVKSSTDQGVNFILRDVTLGPDLGGSFIVEEGLQLGEEIAINGTFSIDAAAQLAGKPSMMNRPETKTMDVPLAFREQITALMNVYFEVKNALVEDNGPAAGGAAIKMEGVLDEVNMGLLEGSSHDKWMELRRQLSEAGAQITKTDDIEVQREHFQVLSEAVLEVTEYFGLDFDTVYKQFCPMAFDDEGAHWLSESEHILNPYFGASMLNCGEVMETYRKGQPVYTTLDSKSKQASEGHNH